jgi:acetoin utilization protein AcuB
MFVRMWMTVDVVTVEADTPIMEARDLMKQRNVRRLPVMKGNALAGIVTQGDIQEAGPSDATSLSIWELNYLLARTKVADIMTRETDLITVSPDDPVEQVALLMRERKVSGLPVLDGDKLIGVITESDIFAVLLSVMGVRQGGSRLTLALDDQPGKLAEALDVVRKHESNILSLVSCEECRQSLENAEGKTVVVVRIEDYDFRKIVKELKDSGVLVLDAQN